VFFSANPASKIQNTTSKINAISDGFVFEIATNLTIYDVENASLVCQMKRGHLVVIDSDARNKTVDDLIKSYLKKFTLPNATFLIGK
jgi:hypothetical protein